MNFSTQATPRKRFKGLTLSLLKFGFATGLVAYLISEETLDFAQISVLLDKPQGLVASLLVWWFATAMLGAKRWQILLGGIGIKIAYFSVLRLHLIGFFFNLAMPGAVGGDLVKVLYVIKDRENVKRINAMLSVIVDRIIGMSSLFILAGAVFLVRFQEVWSYPEARPLMIATLTVLFGIACFFAGVLYPRSSSRVSITSLLKKEWIGFPFLRAVYDALRLYRDSPQCLFSGFLLSIIIQSANIFLLWLYTGLLTESFPSFSQIALVFPAGIVACALPISPGGFGVGHLAFENLYLLVGLSQGANVYNIYLLTNTGLNLLGVVPYLIGRSKIKATVLENEKS